MWEEMNISLWIYGTYTLTETSVHDLLTFAIILSGTQFTLSRDELLTLPEFVLLSLFPNGLLPDGHMGGSFHEGDVYCVDVSGRLCS
jgi:hypothetical protein